jgi:ABC-type dipeptide/oligopeptide/nickel transport system permease component
VNRIVAIAVPAAMPTLARAARVSQRLLFDVAIPLAMTYAMVAILADPDHIDTSELRSNSLLLSARPLFRVIAPGDELRVAFASSAILLLAAMVFAIAFGVPAGVLYGASRRSSLKAVVWTIATLMASLPAFFWAVALELGLIFVYLHFGVRPLPIAGFGVDEHLVLPALALGLRPAAYIFRLTAIAVEEIGHSDYVRTAVAKGLRDRTLLRRHVLPNAAPNIVAATVLATRSALSSLLIVEFVYIWGGAGLMFVQSVALRRLDTAIAIAMAFAVGSALLAFAADSARSRMRAAT